jgi:hypothetical protein
MESIFQRNRLSFTTLAVVAAYVVIAATTHVVMLGILPVLLSFRAFRRGEMFAPFALVGALAAVLIAVSALSHN